MSAALLTVMRNGKEIKSVSVEGEVSLGRADGNVIRLDDRAISRRHAMFKEVAEGIQVLRQSDLAPLRVNGAECTQAVLQNGDVIEIGPYLVRLNRQTDSQTPAAPASATPQQFAAPEPVPVVAGEALAMAQLESAPPAESAGLEFADPLTMEEQGSSKESASEPEVGAPAEEPIPGFEFQDASASASASSPAMAVPFSEDGATQVASNSHLDAKLIFKPGDANVTELAVGSQEISLGRGNGCTVVLNDKKSSRKHAIIRRAGVAFTIRDLDSANGVYVNGERITASQDVELSGDSIIQIGNVEFTLSAVNKEYEQQAPHFEPVPEEVPEAALPQFEAAPLAPLAPLDAPLAPLPDFNAAIPTPEMGQPLTGIPVGGNAAGGSQSLVSKFKALPPRTRILVIVALAAGVYFGVEEGIIPPELLGLAPAPQKKEAPVAKPVSKTGTQSVTFDSLRPEQKQFVEAQHELAFTYFKNQDWDNSLYALERIFQIIPDYKDSREIQKYAQQGKKKKEALEEERKRLEEETRIKERVAVLIEETSVLMEAKQFEEAKEKFAEILSIDPDNPRIADWKKQLEEFESQKQLAAQRKAVLAEINARARERLNEGIAMTRKGQWYTSIPVFREVLEMQATDPRIVREAKNKLGAAASWIRARRDPLLAEAAALEKEKQYAAAYKLYRQASKVDPGHPIAPAGIRRIRGVLHDQSKSLYTEAVLAESYSDFKTAEQKYRAVLETAPEDDLYYERATRKLGRFLRFPASSGGGEEGVF